jgi:Kef-type K+ transport system membrane component KefB
VTVSSFQIGTHLFLQLAVIVATCRVAGWLGKRWLAQTQVFMEMVAGVVLGPSALGLISPELQRWLFPKQLAVQTEVGTALVTHPNMVILYALAQVGLVLYMFVIGLEFDVRWLRGRAVSAGLVSATGVLVPFAVAGAFLPYLLARGDLFSDTVTWGIAWLFVGASIAITAFPMLARILHEHGIAATPLGTLTLAAGSIDDAVAWCLLAVVVALFQRAPDVAVATLCGGGLYGTLMMTVGRSLLRGFERAFQAAGNRMSGGLFAGVIVVLMTCAWLTDRIGIYAVFGAFVCGAAMPKQDLSTALSREIEKLTTTLFLPLFFVYSGLNTKIGLLDSVELWLLAAVVVLGASLGKGVACTLAARVGGETWRGAMLVGTLMNARGLMELILLNIGLERGVITPTFFTIMVIMAVVTTGLASPLYRVLSRGVDVFAGTRPGEVAPAPQRARA